MWIGWIEFDILLGDVHSLKQKRSVVRPIIAELHRRFAVSAAETGAQDLHRRGGICAAVTTPSRQWLRRYAPLPAHVASCAAVAA